MPADPHVGSVRKRAKEDERCEHTPAPADIIRAGAMPTMGMAVGCYEMPVFTFVGGCACEGEWPGPIKTSKEC